MLADHEDTHAGQGTQQPVSLRAGAPASQFRRASAVWLIASLVRGTNDLRDAVAIDHLAQGRLLQVVVITISHHRLINSRMTFPHRAISILM
jgi:hypothetical protein